MMARPAAAPAAEPLLLQARSVAKAYGGVPALRAGALDLQAGSVHALCGGNGAGKSTFLGILMGLVRRDGGEILLKGRPVDFHTPAQALQHRMAIITQELSPVPGMTVAENLYLGREPRRAGCCVDFPAMRRQAQALLDRLGFDIDARAGMASLSLAQMQLVEIARAFGQSCDVLIMDEPTSALGERETQVLFDAIRRVAAQGTGIIYVSHRLSEIFQIADHYTVLRDGGFIESGRLAEIDRARLVSAIVGRPVQARPAARREAGAVVLDAQALGRRGEFQDISLQAHAGEVLGIYGLMGAGRSEFLNCLYGLTRPDQGQARLHGRPLCTRHPARNIAAGLSLVTEDRKATGLVLGASIRDNITLAAWRQLSTWRVWRRRRVASLVQGMVGRLRMKTASTALPVSSMSGGNQQKVVLARCLSTRPSCLLCDEPTRGIDEGAKREIYQLLDEFARAGGAVVLVSSEAPELLELSDRIAVFKAGRLVHLADGHTLSQEELLHRAS